MGISEFEEAYDEDDPDLRTVEEQRLGEAILNAPIRALDPKPAAQLPETATIREAIRLMLERGIGAVLVVEGGRVVGIFTERDVLMRVIREKRDPARTRLGDVMTSDPEALRSDDRICYAVNRMHGGGFRTVPVVDDEQRPIGIVTVNDILRWLADIFPEAILNLRPGDKLRRPSEIDSG